MEIIVDLNGTSETEQDAKNKAESLLRRRARLFQYPMCSWIQRVIRQRWPIRLRMILTMSPQAVPVT